jgi:ABC-type glycerol-3-phosphate transport system substrate-binding protein
MLGEEMATAKWNAGDIPAFKFASIPEPVSFLQAGVYNSMQKTATGFYIGNYDGSVQATLWAALQELMAGKITPEEAMAKAQVAYEAVEK